MNLACILCVGLSLLACLVNSLPADEGTDRSGRSRRPPPINTQIPFRRSQLDLRSGSQSGLRTASNPEISKKTLKKTLSSAFLRGRKDSSKTEAEKIQDGLQSILEQLKSFHKNFHKSERKIDEANNSYQKAATEKEYYEELGERLEEYLNRLQKDEAVYLALIKNNQGKVERLRNPSTGEQKNKLEYAKLVLEENQIRHKRLTDEKLCFEFISQDTQKKKDSASKQEKMSDKELQSQTENYVQQTLTLFELQGKLRQILKEKDLAVPMPITDGLFTSSPAGSIHGSPVPNPAPQISEDLLDISASLHIPERALDTSRASSLTPEAAFQIQQAASPIPRSSSPNPGAVSPAPSTPVTEDGSKLGIVYSQLLEDREQAWKKYKRFLEITNGREVEEREAILTEVSKQGKNYFVPMESLEFMVHEKYLAYSTKHENEIKKTTSVRLSEAQETFDKTELAATDIIKKVIKQYLPPNLAITRNISPAKKEVLRVDILGKVADYLTKTPKESKIILEEARAEAALLRIQMTNEVCRNQFGDQIMYLQKEREEYLTNTKAQITRMAESGKEEEQKMEEEKEDKIYQKHKVMLEAKNVESKNQLEVPYNAMLLKTTCTITIHRLDWIIKKLNLLVDIADERDDERRKAVIALFDATLTSELLFKTMLTQLEEGLRDFLELSTRDKLSRPLDLFGRLATMRAHLGRVQVGDGLKESIESTFDSYSRSLNIRQMIARKPFSILPYVNQEDEAGYARNVYKPTEDLTLARWCKMIKDSILENSLFNLAVTDETFSIESIRTTGYDSLWDHYRSRGNIKYENYMEGLFNTNREIKQHHVFPRSIDSSSMDNLAEHLINTYNGPFCYIRHFLDVLRDKGGYEKVADIQSHEDLQNHMKALLYHMKLFFAFLTHQAKTKKENLQASFEGLKLGLAVDQYTTSNRV